LSFSGKSRDEAATAADLKKPAAGKHFPLALILPFLVPRHSHNQSAAGLGTKLPVSTLSVMQKMSSDYIISYCMLLFTHHLLLCDALFYCLNHILIEIF